ncbi:MAG: DNA polymerase II large subunit [Nanoarchaeota archaeon]
MEKKACSPAMERYFKYIDDYIARSYDLTRKARSQGLDPEDDVPIPLSSDMAERVEGLISVLVPQIANKGMPVRIKELEEQFGSLDWRVALKIAEDVANKKFCEFKDDKEAWETGIRVGLAYLTMGTVASPLEGFLEIKIRKTQDGKDYWAIFFGGPIRSAGGTMAAVTVVIADYLRVKKGFAPFDATENEVNRNVTELYDYHERVTNLQYLPHEDEIKFLSHHLPVQVDGDPSEKFEVSNYKDLPRVETNLIRNGLCLVIGEGIAQKATKVWAYLNQWGKDFDLGHWSFMGEFVDLQKKIKAHAKKDDSSSGPKPKILPDYTFIKDLVAGRPVFTHPLRAGGFRLRFGRARTSGFSSYCIHPATMWVLNQYLATGTQLKLERPGKATSLTACDSIEGPIVKLSNGSVLMISTLEEAKRLYPSVTDILFLGDILINYGDFANRKHILVPPGYCEEWWLLEVKKSIDEKAGGDIAAAALSASMDKDRLIKIVETAFWNPVSWEESLSIQKALDVPMHPAFSYHWKTVSAKDVAEVISWLSQSQLHETGGRVTKIVIADGRSKSVLELAGVPHILANGFVVIEGDHASSIAAQLRLGVKDLDVKSILDSAEPKPADGFEAVSLVSPLKFRDKSGIFIGARMGRPEKAKLRELAGSPEVLFPVGEEGGRLRSFQSALAAGGVTSDFPAMTCPSCKCETVYRTCEECGSRTVASYYCRQCKAKSSEQVCSKHGPCVSYTHRKIDIKHYFDSALKKLKMQVYPDLIKGVKGTSNKEHIPEHLAKGILRSHHDIAVNKDGTTRYDMTQLAITHFTPAEVFTSVDRLRELGYNLDCYNRPLERSDQVLELKPQDIILPTLDLPMEGADKALFRVGNFIDDELERLYGLPRFYNLQSPKDLVGHLVLCLAPHTSAGLAARIIGFSKTQGFFAHPMVHAAQRRDCDGDESCVTLLMDALLNFSRKYLPSSRGSTQDAPLVLTSRLVPSEVDDMAFDVDTVWEYPLDFYNAAVNWKDAKDVKIEQIKHRLGKPSQYEGMGFTHPISDINYTIQCSAYKTLPTMDEKLAGQMEIAKKVRAVDTDDVARLVIEKHFIKDTKGNLRKFSMQQFRCIGCNEKFRRPPLIGRCTKCKGRVIFTISEGSVVKYLGPTIMLAKKYGASPYLSQTINLLERRFHDVFGKEKEKQAGLAGFFTATSKVADKANPDSVVLDDVQDSHPGDLDVDLDDPDNESQGMEQPLVQV